MGKNSYAVITGASSGIGREFAKRFASMGFPLVLVARREQRLALLAGLIHEAIDASLDIVVLPADLAKTQECIRVMEALKGRRLAFFINNAGFGDCSFFPEGKLDKELRMIDVNVKAVHLLTKLALKKMETQGCGYILNVASSAGLMPAGPFMATYYATKAYVASMTRAAAEELRQRGSGIYIGCLCPGPVDTEFDEVADVTFALHGISAEYCANYAVDQMKKRRVVIVPTFPMKAAMTLGRFLPQPLYIRIAAHQQKKKIGLTKW